MRAPPGVLGALTALVIVSVSLPIGARGQEEPDAVAQDPLFDALFAPELIMQHRRAIGLDDQQRDAISQLIGDLQGDFLSLQWELLDEVERMAEITDRPRVDLDQALDQMDDVLEIEKRMKQAHLETLVRIKNLLSPEQQATLRRLRDAGAGVG